MELKKKKHSPLWQIIMMIMTKLYNRFKLVYITISTASLVHNRQLILAARQSALNTVFLYRTMFGAFVLFGCWD